MLLKDNIPRLNDSFRRATRKLFPPSVSNPCAGCPIMLRSQASTRVVDVGFFLPV